MLLFQVGLQSDIREMRRLGPSSLLAAVMGITASFALGWGAAVLLLPGADSYVQVFVAVVVASSSIGIAARVFHDLRRLQTPEARTVLGAAVIDDVIGLMMLTIAAGIIKALDGGTGLSCTDVLMVIAKALVFLAGTLVIGRRLAPRIYHLASRMKAPDLLLTVSLGLCFGFGYLAKLVGLAPIIGAFAAGLTLEEKHYKSFSERGEQSVLELLKPIVGFLAPIFFFVTGARVDLAQFANPSVWALALGLAAASIAGKQFCGLGVLKRGISRLTVGIGMIPRGEVGTHRRRARIQAVDRWEAGRDAQHLLGRGLRGRLHDARHPAPAQVEPRPQEDTLIGVMEPSRYPASAPQGTGADRSNRP